MTKKGSQHGLSLHQTVWSICSSTFVSAGDCQNPGSQSENNVFNVFVSRKGNLLSLNLLCLLLQRCHVFSSKREPDLLVLGCTKIPYPKNYGISKLVAWRSKNNPSEFHILTPCTPWKINGINCCKPENKRKIIWTKPSFPCRFELLIFLFFLSTDWLVHQVYIDTWMKFDYRSALPELVGGHGGYQLTWWLLRLFIYLRLGGGFRWICGPPAWNTLKK